MRSNLLLFIGAVVGLVLAGCTESEGPTNGFDSDQAYLEYAVANADSIAAYSEGERYALDDDGAKPMEYTEGFGKVGDAMYPIIPLRWGRHVMSVNRTVSVDIQGDTVAIATIERTIAGELIILAIKDSGGVVDTVLVTKPFSNTVTRKVRFVRVARTDFLRLNWRPVAITLVDGRSPTNDFNIAELRFIIRRRNPIMRDTITVTDPLNTWLRFGRMYVEIPYIRLVDSVQVQVTVASQNDSAEFVALRWGVGWGDGRRHRARMPLVSTSGGAGAYTRIYERTFARHTHYGRFNAVIDAFSYDTFYDDAAAYSNKFWGIPYIAPPF